ncbi:hypothetical protein MRX96_012792 [Rhipicephalus microplus]
MMGILTGPRRGCGFGGGPESTAELLTPTTDAYANQTVTTTTEEEAVHSSLHDYIVYQCNVENDVIKVLEGFLKIVYFGDYHRLLGMIEQFFAH